MTQRRGVRISQFKDGTLWIGQTIQRGIAQNSPYVIERGKDGKNIERFVSPAEGDTGLLKAVRDALNGQL